MKIILLAVACLTFLFFIIKNHQREYAPPSEEQLINTILAETAVILKNKYDLIPCGVGVAMPGGPIRSATLCFNTQCPYTKEQLRILLVKSAQELITQINSNNEIQEFLWERPFNLTNVQIIIYNYNKDGSSVQDPGVSNAQILEGTLDYASDDPQDAFKYKTRSEETYEEALKAISSS